MITQIIGTNRPNSNTSIVARFIQKIYTRLKYPSQIVDLSELPQDLFCPSAYANKPASFKPIVDKVLEAKGLHVITPEYNGGAPGVLKYFIDMLPFPESFESRPVAFVGLAAGAWGGLRPVEQLQQIFSYRNAFIFPQRIFIPSVNNMLNEEGLVTDDKIVAYLEKQAKGFIEFIQSFEK